MKHSDARYPDEIAADVARAKEAEAKEKAERPLDAAACSPGDIANGLLHAADDHPCCKETLYAAVSLLEEMKNTIYQRDQAARLVRRLLRSHEEKSSRRSVAARSDAGLWLASYDRENTPAHPPQVG